MILSFQRNILNRQKFHDQLKVKSYGAYYTKFIYDVDLQIHFSQDLSQGDQDDLAAFVSGFVDFTSADQLAAYLEGSVFPFVKSLINAFAAENISLGITQVGKTADVLSIFEKQYPVASGGKTVSLKGTFDTGSLYVAIAVIEHVRANPTEFDGLSPFVTDARLLAMKNSIERFLGVPLTP